jgi:hypothetical protein
VGKDTRLIYKLFEDMSFEGYRKIQSPTASSLAAPGRDALWNTLEPGDPYDIRKYNHSSMQIDDSQAAQ